MVSGNEEVDAKYILLTLDSFDKCPKGDNEQLCLQANALQQRTRPMNRTPNYF